MFLTSPLIEQAIAQACAICSPLVDLGGEFECNRDLYEAAGAADATACSGTGSW